jgi:hypothetical protein
MLVKWVRYLFKPFRQKVTIMPPKKEKPHWPSYARALKRDARAMVEKGGKNFNPLVKKAGSIDDPYSRAIALAWVGRRMEEAKVKARSVFIRAVESATEVDPDWRKAEVLVEIGSEMVRAGLEDLDIVVRAMAGIADEAKREKAVKILRRRMKRVNIPFPDGLLGEEKPRAPPKKKTTTKPQKAPPKKMTLGLYNTYEGKTLMDAHLRAVARAAPLCYAFDFNLALVGFPKGDIGDIVEKVEAATRVGGKGSMLMEMYQGGRIIVLDPPKRTEVPGIGTVVATTSHPDPKKRRAAGDIKKGKAPVLVLMGLGPKGLPGRVLKAAEHHLEVTGSGVPLETCTAMGVICAMLG